MKRISILGMIAFTVLCAGLIYKNGSSASTTKTAAAFTPGDLVVYRVGDGSGVLTSAATAVFLDEYTPAGALVQSIPLPTAVNGANKRLTAAGTSTSEGLMTRSTDGAYLVLTGYDADLGTAGITSSTSATVNRVIGRADAAGNIDTTTALTDAISGGNPRGAASTNGTDLWMTGTSTGGGARYTTFGSTTSTSLTTTPTNLRAVNIFNNQLYVTSASGSFFGVSSVGAGTPTSAGQTTTILPGFPTATGPSSYQFAVFGSNSIYVADDRAVASGGGIQRWDLSGGTWTLSGTASTGLTAGIRGLTVTTNGLGQAVIYATTADTPSKLVTITDDHGPSIPPVTTLATAATNTAFRSVALVPVSGAPTPSPSASPTPGPNLVGDGGFEDVANSWPLWTTQTSTNFGSPICTGDLCGTDLAFEGVGFLWFGDLANAAVENASVGQNVTIPAGSTATLTFEYAAVDSLTPFNDQMLVKMDGNVIKTFTEPSTPDTAYSLQTIDVSAFADGNPHALLFTYSSPDGKSGFLVDNVSLNAVGGGGPLQADLSITKTDGVTTALPGGSVTYTITASNAGPNAATGANVADTLPAGLTSTWTCVGAGGGTCTAAGAGNINDTVNLPTGGSVTYTVSSAISAAATGTLSNTATVTAPVGTTDPATGNNSATDSDTLTSQADLSITKTDGVTAVFPGTSVAYSITASNAGPSNVTGATVADTFPGILTATWTCAGAGGGTCTAAGAGNINDSTVNLPSGGSVTYTATALISASASGTLSNTATVTAPAGTTDPTPGNNSATDTDSITPLGTKLAQVDMNGDGFTDFVQVRGTGSAFSGNSAGPGANIPRFMGARGRLKYFAQHPNLVSDGAQFQEFWYVLDSQTGAASGTAWGDAATDWNVPADYDGDGRDDIAVWRSGPAGQARFFIIRSSDGTIMAPFLGQEGDDPTVVADYDGDGTDDIAVFSCPTTPGPCSFNYVGSNNNPTGAVTSVSWGTGTPGSISPIAGDYDGDKKADFCVYQEDPGISGQGQYALHKSDGSPDEFVDWGLFASDIVVPGDFDNDGKTDFMVIRDTGGNYVHWLLTRTNQIFMYNWGITDDVPTPGDYDGDGKTDLAVWRPSTDKFYVVNSRDGSTQGVTWGQCSTAPCDEPVADWQVH